LLFLFLNHPNILCINPDILQRWCKSQSADTADADANADEDVDVVLVSLCFSYPPTIVIEQCKLNLIVGVDYEKN
jgi:hypothetical protein